MQPEHKRIETLIEAVTNHPYPKCTFKDIPFFIHTLNIDYQPKIITITGTNGKGSTAKALAYFFLSNHITYVCHTSPHLSCFNERIETNGQMIDSDALIVFLKRIQQASQQLQLKLNYYQIAFLSACLTMQKMRPKWLILEVGIGGRLDPANYFNADIAILTSIGLDHTDVLGDTVEKIAWEKIHIARENRPMILGTRITEKAMLYLAQIGATLYFADSDSVSNKTRLPPVSLACALKAISLINIEYQYHIPENIAQLSVAGRMQQLHSKPDIFTDVAHNLDAVNLMLKRLKAHQKNAARTIAVFSAQKQKPIREIYQLAKSEIDLWLVPALNEVDRRFPIKRHLQSALSEGPLYFFDNFGQSIAHLKHILRPDDLVIVFGSFTLVGLFIKLGQT